MLILSQIYFLILIYWIKAQKIEQCETSIDDQNKEINSRLNNAIKLQDIYERRIDEMVKLFSGIIDKLYDINKKTCLTDKIAFERYDKNTEKAVNKMKSPDKYPNLGKTVSGNIDSCGFWESYKNEKCIKILDDEKLSFEDGEESCMEEDSGSILTIHSKDEQEFISKFLFKTHGIVGDIWIGMKRNNNSNKFMWMDGSEPIFTNWAKEKPSNKSGNNCAQIVSHSGEWIDVPCKKKNFVVCEKIPVLSISLLHKLLLDTKKELEQTRKLSNENDLMFEKYLRHLSNNQWINIKLFSDNDGNKKAFVLPLTDDYYGRPWKDAVALCANLNATLVEIYSWQKKKLFNSFLGQLGSEGRNYKSFWVHSRKDYTGKWKWIRSGKEVFSNDWHPRYPKYNNDVHLAVTLEPNANFGKFFNPEKKSWSNVVCELDVDF